MSDDNGGSLVDSIIAGVIAAYIVMALIILFPLLPGGVLGYEISKGLTENTDIHKLSIIIGMVINYFVYMLIVIYNDIDIHLLSSKVYLYIITILIAMFLNQYIDNPLLQIVSKATSETIKFFLDFDRWFVDNTLINMGLVAIYAYVSFWAISHIIVFMGKLFKVKSKYINKYRG